METMNDISALFKALSDETRLRILNLLLEAGELCVCDIEAVLGCTQTKISRHMGYLTRAGLTADRKSGRWVFYSLSPTADGKRLLRMLRPLLAGRSVPAGDIASWRRRVEAGCCETLNQKHARQNRKEHV
jgi:DNA-binding transcriptional ArsR family regulator